MSDLLLSCHNLEKQMGLKELFSDLSFGIYSNEKIGLIGSNGAGKSTLLKILAKQLEADQGEVLWRKNLKVAYLPQEEDFKGHPSAESFVLSQIEKVQSSGNSNSEEDEILFAQRAQTYLSYAGFEDFQISPAQLSGGWKKKLGLASVFAQEADLVILDEPTNHLDWEGIFWLESFLKQKVSSYILVSHDREFLDRLSNRCIEIAKLYPEGQVSFNGSYTHFLEEKAEYIKSLKKELESLKNSAQTEDQWLKAGVKARTTKNQGRIKRAHELFEKLQKIEEQNNSLQSKSRLRLDDTQRKTKKLIECQSLEVSYPDKKLIQNFNMIMRPKDCIALVGHNGSGKSSLIKSILFSKNSQVKLAPDLKVVYFAQDRTSLPPDQNLMEFLGEGSKHVIFNGKECHVASYASRFLFDQDKMSLPISQLSGGERARLALAKELLKPADVIVLDEPTNDLDIESIEVLEQLVKSFSGLCLLVSHDRKFLSQLCNRFIFLEGNGNWQEFASLEQSLKHLKSLKKASSAGKEEAPSSSTQTPAPSKKDLPKLSYKDKKFLESAEELILKEENQLESLQLQLQKAVESANSADIQKISIEIDQQNQKIEELYNKWSQLNEIQELRKN